MKILIVDDRDYKIRDLISVLKKNNIEYDVADCGRQAMLRLIRNKYDGVVLDMQFPNYTDGRIDIDGGYKILSEMDNRDIKIPVCMHSSDSDLDFSDYENVIMYIVYNSSVYMDNQYKEFIKKVESIKNEK